MTKLKPPFRGPAVLIALTCALGLTCVAPAARGEEPKESDVSLEETMKQLQAGLEQTKKEIAELRAEAKVRADAPTIPSVVPSLPPLAPLIQKKHYNATLGIGPQYRYNKTGETVDQSTDMSVVAAARYSDYRESFNIQADVRANIYSDDLEDLGADIEATVSPGYGTGTLDHNLNIPLPGIYARLNRKPSKDPVFQAGLSLEPGYFHNSASGWTTSISAYGSGGFSVGDGFAIDARAGGRFKLMHDNDFILTASAGVKHSVHLAPPDKIGDTVRNSSKALRATIEKLKTECREALERTAADPDSIEAGLAALECEDELAHTETDLNATIDLLNKVTDSDSILTSQTSGEFRISAEGQVAPHVMIGGWAQVGNSPKVNYNAEKIEFETLDGVDVQVGVSVSAAAF